MFANENKSFTCSGKHTRRRATQKEILRTEDPAVNVIATRGFFHSTSRNTTFLRVLAISHSASAIVLSALYYTQDGSGSSGSPIIRRATPIYITRFGAYLPAHSNKCECTHAYTHTFNGGRVVWLFLGGGGRVTVGRYEDRVRTYIQSESTLTNCERTGQCADVLRRYGKRVCVCVSFACVCPGPSVQFPFPPQTFIVARKSPQQS